MSDKIVTLAMFHDPMAAEMTRARLAAEGIPAMISGDNAGTLFGGTLAMVQLQISEENLPRATRILEAMEESLEDDDDGPNLPLREFSDNSGIQSDRPGTGRHTGGLTETGIAPTRLPPARTPDLEDDDLPIRSGPDEIANRAWRAAIIGFIALPPLLHFYSLAILWSIADNTEEPSPSAMRRIYGALALDFLGFSFAGLLFWLVLRGAW